MRFHHALAASFALALAALGCGGQSSRPFAAIPVTVDPHAPRDERFLVWGGTVAVDGLVRTVLSASRAVMPPAQVTHPGAQQQVTFPIPAEMKAASWIVLEAVVTRDDTTSMIRSWPVAGTQAGGTYSIGLLDEQVGPGGQPGVRLHPAPDLATRDVDTAEVTVPEHAVLQVGMALEQASWPSTTSPIDMRVSAVTPDGITALGTTQLDVRRPEQRQWIDVTIPLDAVAGRTVRLRFAARPSIGPTAVPSLPVWAEPMIVDARLVGK
jgi:hypothetical protein